MGRIKLVACLVVALVAAVLVGCSGAAQVESSASASSSSAAQSAPSVSADDVQLMAETWVVGGLYYKDKLYDVSDEESLENLYDTTMLTLNDDGTFVYLRLYGDRGSWSRKSPDDDTQFLLKVESSFRMSMEKGSFVEKEIDPSQKVYLLTRLDENTASFVEYDESTGKAVEGDNPLVFVKQGCESAYIAKNKTPISKKASGESAASGSSASASATSGSSASGSSAADDSGKKTSSAKSTESTNRNKSTDEDDDFEIVESGYDDANGKGYKGSDGNYYFKDNDGSVMATDGKGNGVKDVDGDGEADYYTTDSGQTWHSM